MTTAMATGHQHHSMQASDMEVLDMLTKLPSTRNVLNGGSVDEGASSFGHTSLFAKRRPLDTLQALRRPPIDPIVFAASLSTGPHVTRHHFLHSFGPKVESRQMKRSEREIRLRNEGEDESGSSSSHLMTSSVGNGRPPFRRPRAGSYANCDAEARSALQEVEEIVNAIEEQPDASRAAYPSKQAPRSERLRLEKEAQAELQKQKEAAAAESVKSPNTQGKSRPEIVRLPSEVLDEELLQRRQRLQHRSTQQATSASALPSNAGAAIAADALNNNSQAFSSIVRPPPLHVRCYARTRIPTPHGEIFCHLYRNNRDQKEHLALVVDPAQNDPQDEYATNPGRLIRSQTLDEVWGPTETEMERIVRGAYVGRLGPTVQKASRPQTSTSLEPVQMPGATDTPLVRIHSECYTGETIGSQRCDCGEQLDEALRLIHLDARPAKGVVVYLRQEGRGIGLLDKLMAYNLQDMGHDTVAANILLGHLADARKYDIAAEILRDLGVGSCRLLTNNPEKMEALEVEGIRVTRRVAMVPRIWRLPAHGQSRRKSHRQRSKRQSQRIRWSKQPLDASIISQLDSDSIAHTQAKDSDGDEHALLTSYDDEGDEEEAEEEEEEDTFSDDSYVEHLQRRAGATLVGGSITRGPELEKYLRTKVERMGHMLDLPSSGGAPEIKAEAETERTFNGTEDEDEEKILIASS